MEVIPIYEPGTPG